jgi:hypothetical protein
VWLPTRDEYEIQLAKRRRVIVIPPVTMSAPTSAIVDELPPVAGSKSVLLPACVCAAVIAVVDVVVVTDWLCGTDVVVMAGA